MVKGFPLLTCSNISSSRRRERRKSPSGQKSFLSYTRRFGKKRRDGNACKCTFPFPLLFLQIPVEHALNQNRPRSNPCTFSFLSRPASFIRMHFTHMYTHVYAWGGEGDEKGGIMPRTEKPIPTKLYFPLHDNNYFEQTGGKRQEDVGNLCLKSTGLFRVKPSVHGSRPLYVCMGKRFSPSSKQQLFSKIRMCRAWLAVKTPS